MKTILKNYLTIVLFVLPLSFLLHSCHEKGCTNRLALNYNVTADVDDGSCIVCNTISTQIGLLTAPLVDYNTASDFYTDTVAWFYIYQNELNYNTTLCGKQQSTISLKIENTIDKGIFMNFLVSSSGPVNINHSSNATLTPFQSQDWGVYLTDNSPPFISIYADSSTFTATTNGHNIVYF